VPRDIHRLGKSGQSPAEDDFFHILKEPKNALTKQYEALFNAEDVTLDFQEEALHEIAEIAFKVNGDVENIGARRLHTVMSHLLNDLLFDMPDVIAPNAQVVITRELVIERLDKLVKTKDLSEYIL
jgi:ATP-dependent HslUV protease ATP-binding subunit HslU